jgi:hypothetical protein
MGIRVFCPNGHKLNVKSFLAGKRGVCPHCGAKFDIPAEKGDASDEKVQSVGTVSARGETTTATASSTSSAELRAGHLAKGYSGARRGVATAASAVSPAGSVAPVTPVSQPSSAVPAMPSVPLGAGQPVAAPSVAVQPVKGGSAGVPVSVVAAAGDPLSEAPEASWYVRPPSGGQYGPAKAHTIREWMAQGRITGDSLVWREGWPDWKLAGATFPGLGAVGAAAPVVDGARPAVAAAMPAATADDPLAALGPSPSSTSRRPLPARRSHGMGHFLAIAVLCIALVVLSALLVYVLKLQ